MKEKRPDPDELLKLVEAEERQGESGKLRIYLGAAPGVGKTYSMLGDARAQYDQGLDIVVGVVESHGRKEIEALMTGLEILPRQLVDYRGIKLTEFDLDAALKRNPGIILIDEMAHTNAPGLRHEKRWQDIQELLNRGIDVYTTVNVQHIDSRKDDVAKIIHANIKESVPDSMFEMADSIELVDIPPEDLLKRLQEGKVYFPQQAELAKDHFFRVGNLIALREIALRYTADRVGAEVLSYRRGQGIKHIWPTRNKIVVCVGPGESQKLIRTAARIAKSLNAVWIGLYIDNPRLNYSEEDRNRAVHKLRYAERLGAETRLIVGVDIVKEIIGFAREENITQIIIWKSSHQTWADYLKIWKKISSGKRVFSFSRLADKIVRNSGDIDVYVMTGEKEETKLSTTPAVKPRFPWLHYLASVGIVAAATLVVYCLSPFLSGANGLMVYFFGVFLVAIYDTFFPMLFTAFLSVLVCNYLFLQDYNNFSIYNGQDLFKMAIIFLIAVILNYYTTLSKREAFRARQAQQAIGRLHSLSRQLATTRGVEKLLNIGVEYVAEILDCEVQALLPEDGHLVVRAKSSTDWVLDAKELSVAQWVNDLGQMAGLGTDTLPFSKALYVPLLASHGTIGVLSVRPKNAERLFTPQQMRLLEGSANQLAISLEVDLHHEQAKKSELKMATDHVRESLLQSFSQDLRMPLISIMGAANRIIEVGADLEKQKIQQLEKEIFIESEQLNRLINNLLQVTNLETQGLPLNKEKSDIEALVQRVLDTPSKKMLTRIFKMNFEEKCPDVLLDETLIQEVLHNLIDNAVKFSPPETVIEISTRIDKNKLIISIEDQGPGLSSGELNGQFEKFYRGKMISIERGMGLGLAVCRTIIKAHGGEIWAENLKEGGVAFRFSLPL